MTYAIKGWHRFQHFKDRKPPWIKLYREILDDLDWHQLEPEAAKVLVMLWLIASEDDGRLPNIKKLAFRLRLTEQKAMSLINKLSHWVEQTDIGAISDRHHGDALETETETETETDTGKPPQKKRSSKTALPDDFCISTRVQSWAQEKGHHSLQAHFENFVSAAKAKGYTYADWDEALMNAIRNNWAKVPDKKERRVAL